MIDKSNTKNISAPVILPFYLYAAISFLVATVLLEFSTPVFSKHYFHPHTLAITHIMALGWGTMIILGASHQIIPFLTEGKLHSNKLAFTSFLFAAIGIPLLIYGLYSFNMGWPAKWGGRFVIISIVCYVINLATSINRNKTENVHAIFVFTASIWLLATTTSGLALVYNFTFPLMPKESILYLPLHAHTGVVGWFLLLVIGVSSRLIPTYLKSTYRNDALLWWIYGLMNTGLISFVFIFLLEVQKVFMLFSLFAIACAILLFTFYCRQSYAQRTNQKLDEQLRISLLSVWMMLLPVVFLAIIISAMLVAPIENLRLVLTYGFVIFFGWITAIILAMTFKTLPNIIWNKLQSKIDVPGKITQPTDLFSSGIFKIMSVCYFGGFLLFAAGILFSLQPLMQAAAGLLIISAMMYNWNVIKILAHRPSQ